MNVPIRLSTIKLLSSSSVAARGIENRADSEKVGEFNPSYFHNIITFFSMVKAEISLIFSSFESISNEVVNYLN